MKRMISNLYKHRALNKNILSKCCFSGKIGDNGDEAVEMCENNDIESQIDDLMKKYGVKPSKLNIPDLELRYFRSNTVPSAEFIRDLMRKENGEELDQAKRRINSAAVFKEKLESSSFEEIDENKKNITVTEENEGLIINIANTEILKLPPDDYTKLKETISENFDETPQIYVDGASVNNPGKAGCSVIIFMRDRNIINISISLGIASNNYAEYMGLIYGLIFCKVFNIKTAKFFSDSQLVVRQLKGLYKVKNSNIKALVTLANEMIDDLEWLEITYIERELNKVADFYAKKSITMGKKYHINFN